MKVKAPGSLPRRRKKNTPPSAAAPPHVSCPIVGIGSSAGGLEALEQFLSHVPKRSGMAFVVVQHLDPTRKGFMPELLQRMTDMKVIQVKDRTVVRPNCVYVIPPNKDMCILHRVLHLLEPTTARGLRLPINFFLRSLGQDGRDSSIAVILSGMGSDGTLGAKTVKENGGIVLVQDPETAKFAGMPRSAIDSGSADIVASAGDLPGRIMTFLKPAHQERTSNKVIENKTLNALEKAIILLRTHTGHDFSLYKKNTFYRRIERRMGIHQISKIGDYVRYLQENSQELELLFKELLIGVTTFFRDPACWDELRGKILPALVASKPNGNALRAWVPGCSTGEEAYSLAIVFKEVMAKIQPRGKFTLQVFATDLDKDAIDKARQGIYPEAISTNVPRECLRRYFIRDEQGYRVRGEIREMVIFAQQSLIMDPPFTKLDILSCRNLLIYLEPEMQKKLIPLFHYSLIPGGILFLGSSETIGGFTDLFKPLNNKLRIFRRTESDLRSDSLDFPSSITPPMTGGTNPTPPARTQPSLQMVADQLVLENYSSPTVLVNDKGNILYVSGRTGKYLEPAAGKANWNIFAMTREDLRYELSNAFHKALEKKGTVNVGGLEIRNGRSHQCVDVSVQYLEQPAPLRGLIMIVFKDVSAAFEVPAKDGKEKPAKNSVGAAKIQEFRRKYEKAIMEAQTVREEMQTSREELRSTNEEQQSTNEELQSTNEELVTSKEEMQSLNEELQTINAELQIKVDELSQASSDMKNLLNSTDIATLFLDRKLNVRRFTTQAAAIIKLIPGDIGRPITDLGSDLLYPQMTGDAKVVLKKLGFVEKQINSRDGRWFTVRIMPYRTLNDHIDGVVITFADITVAKTLEARLREQHSALEKIVTQKTGRSGNRKRTRVK